MRLWTIQPIEVLYEIKNKGFYICDEKKSDLIQNYVLFKRAYDWLVLQMIHKIGRPPKGVKYPVWGWYLQDWKNKKPDLRQRHGERGQLYVCIELEIPESRIVLSDFDAWHFVLNNSYLDETNSEQEWENLHKYLDCLPDNRLDKLRRESWNRVFDITPFKNDWRSNGRYVQATFWVLYKSDIVNIQRFKSK